MISYETVNNTITRGEWWEKWKYGWKDKEGVAFFHLNLFVLKIKCWVIFIIWVLICNKSGLSKLYPFTKISYCLFFDRLLNWGIYCSTWSKSILLSSVKSQQHVTKCSEFSFGSSHKHFGLSIFPTWNLCEFKLDLSTLIWVKRVHSFFWPLEKCLYF